MLVGVALVLAAAVSGCVCVCAEPELGFDAACHERGGQVQSHGARRSCVMDDAGVVATWVDEEDGGQ
jgi:hypothetical protein